MKNCIIEQLAQHLPLDCLVSFYISSKNDFYPTCNYGAIFFGRGRRVHLFKRLTRVPLLLVSCNY